MCIFTRAIAVLLIAAVAATIGLNIGPTPEDVRRTMASPEYKQQELEYWRGL
jgi:hypothetical protein